MEGVGLSYEYAQNRDQLRLKIKGNRLTPEFIWKMAAKVVCACEFLLYVTGQHCTPLVQAIMYTVTECTVIPVNASVTSKLTIPIEPTPQYDKEDDSKQGLTLASTLSLPRYEPDDKQTAQEWK